MKIRTSEAARELGIHPAHLLQHVAGLDSELSFEDVWPLIEKGYVDTVSAMGHYRNAELDEHEQEPESELQPAVSVEISADSRLVVNKLVRQGKWGSVSVSFEALLNLTRLGKRDLEEALHELRNAGLLDHDGAGRRTISLNSSMRGEIENIAQQELPSDK